jgi:hypothetical protein
MERVFFIKYKHYYEIITVFDIKGSKKKGRVKI